MQQTSKYSSVKKLFLIKQVPGIKEYLEETEFLKNARVSAESLKIPIVDDETGRFLELACYLLKPSKILEIGCGTGYSTYFLLKSILPELTAGKSTGVRDRAIESAGSKAIGPTGDKANNSKKQFSYTGIDLNRKRLDQACLFIGGLIKKTIVPGPNGKRVKNVIECENSNCSFEFIHGNAVKIIQAEKETAEKYDLVFIDAAKFEYPCYLEAVKERLSAGCAVIADNIFYCGRLFREEILKHDANSVAGLTEYLRIITGDDTFETSLFNIGDGIALSLYNKDK